MAWDKNLIAEGVLAPDLNDEIRANWAALETALGKEMNFSTGGTASLQGILKQGSARMFSQASAPATRVDGSAFAATDLGLLWIDTDNNKIYSLTATTPTWTLISTEIIATLLASARTFAAAVTFDEAAILSKAPTLTEGIVANNAYLQGRNQADDGNVNLIKAGTNNLSTLPDSAEMASSAAPVENEAIVNKKYVDDQTLSAIPLFARVRALVKFNADGNIEGTSFNITSVVNDSTGVYTITWDTNFADVNYILSITPEEDNRAVRYTTEAVGSVKVHVRSTSTQNVSQSGCSVIAYGNQ